MNITSATFYSTKELLSRIKKVKMLADPSVAPYAKSDISITSIEARLLSPAQLYVLRGEFEKVRALRWGMLAKFGVDILRFTDSYCRDGKAVDSDVDRADHVGFAEITLEGSADTITVLPPVVEVSPEADGTIHNIINDGMHRCFLARSCRIVPTVVLVSKVPPELPYYAYPLAGGWDDVAMVGALDGSILKKYHRMPDYKKFYRDFNSAFTNVGGPRGQG